MYNGDVGYKSADDVILQDYFRVGKSDALKGYSRFLPTDPTYAKEYNKGYLQGLMERKL